MTGIPIWFETSISFCTYRTLYRRDPRGSIVPSESGIRAKDNALSLARVVGKIGTFLHPFPVCAHRPWTPASRSLDRSTHLFAVSIPPRWNEDKADGLESRRRLRAHDRFRKPPSNAQSPSFAFSLSSLCCFREFPVCLRRLSVPYSWPRARLFLRFYFLCFQINERREEMGKSDSTNSECCLETLLKWSFEAIQCDYRGSSEVCSSQ